MALTNEERDRLAYLEARKKAEPTAMDKAKAFGFGAVKSVAGGLGDVEKFASYTVPEMFGFKQDENKQEVKKAVGRETILPTSEDVGQVYY